MLSEVLLAIFAGASIAIMAKLGTGHRSRGAFVFAGLVGAFGGILGLFASRMVGVPRENEGRVWLFSAAFGLLATLVYAALSRIATRRSMRRGAARSSIAF